MTIQLWGVHKTPLWDNKGTSPTEELLLLSETFFSHYFLKLGSLLGTQLNLSLSQLLEQGIISGTEVAPSMKKNSSISLIPLGDESNTFSVIFFIVSVHLWIEIIFYVNDAKETFLSLLKTAVQTQKCCAEG